ncbi:MAG: TatD family hydrolase, partial [Phototrophicaceae bacterium]
MLVDTHCHLNFDSYDPDRQAVIAQAAAVGVTRIINPGVDLETSQAGIALAAQYQGVFAAVGIHPNSTANFQLGEIAALRELAQAHPQAVVAIGEIGLDYYRDRAPKDQQFKAFEAQ